MRANDRRRKKAIEINKIKLGAGVLWEAGTIKIERLGEKCFTMCVRKR